MAVARAEQQAAAASRSEFADLLSMLETSSLVRLKAQGSRSSGLASTAAAMVARDRGTAEVTLAVQPSEVEEGVAASPLLQGLVARAVPLVK